MRRKTGIIISERLRRIQSQMVILEQYSPSPIKTFRRFCFLIAFSCDPRRRIRRSCSMRRAREKERNAERERERERERAVKQTIVSVVSCKRIRNRQVQLHVAKLQKSACMWRKRSVHRAKHTVRTVSISLSCSRERKSSCIMMVPGRGTIRRRTDAGRCRTCNIVVAQER